MQSHDLLLFIRIHISFVLSQCIFIVNKRKSAQLLSLRLKNVLLRNAADVLSTWSKENWLRFVHFVVTLRLKPAPVQCTATRSLFVYRLVTVNTLHMNLMLYHLARFPESSTKLLLFGTTSEVSLALYCFPG